MLLVDATTNHIMQPAVLRQFGQAKRWWHHRGSFRTVVRSVRSVRCLVCFHKPIFSEIKYKKRLKWSLVLIRQCKTMQTFSASTFFKREKTDNTLTMKSKTSDSLTLLKRLVVDCPDRCVSELHKYTPEQRVVAPVSVWCVQPVWQKQNTRISVSFATFISLYCDVSKIIVSIQCGACNRHITILWRKQNNRISVVCATVISLFYDVNKIPVSVNGVQPAYQ